MYAEDACNSDNRAYLGISKYRLANGTSTSIRPCIVALTDVIIGDMLDFCIPLFCVYMDTTARGHLTLDRLPLTYVWSKARPSAHQLMESDVGV